MNSALSSRPQTQQPIVHSLLLFGLILVVSLFPRVRVWPLGLLLPLFLAAGILWLVPAWRYKAEWLRFGQANRTTICASILIAVSSLVGLVIWQRVCSPDLSSVARLMPSDSGIPWLVMGSLFACINAISEEIICRGVLQEALTVRFGEKHAWWLQGVIFGCLHLNGVPQGGIGVVMASVYGIALGWLRRRSAGIGLCCLVHISTDACIWTLGVGR